jgi:hypothetical protein
MAKQPIQAPLCLALVLADAIHIDMATGKRTILGTFAVIFSAEFPAQHAQLAIYASITDGIGEMDITARIVDVDEEREPVAEMTGKINFEDPRMVAEIGAAFSGVIFPQAGEYRIQLFAESELLMERRLLVVNTSEQQND